MQKIIRLLSITVFLLFLIGCQTQETTEPIYTYTTNPDIGTCAYDFSDTYGQDIIIQNIDVPTSEVHSNPNNFINPCKETTSDQLILRNSDLKTHQVFLYFDAIYPVEYLTLVNNDNNLKDMTVYTSIDGLFYDLYENDLVLNLGENRIPMNDKLIKSVKIIVDNEDTDIQDISFQLGNGYIIREEIELTNMFFRTNGWTGADGIFTFDLNNGGDNIGLDHTTTGFIFSDTFIGEIRPNSLRSNYEIVNNTFGYLNDNEMTFVWDDSGENPESVLKPDSYIGYKARNLLDGDGLSITHNKDGLLTNNLVGTMWKSNVLNNELVIDLLGEYDVKDIYIWNYNLDKTLGVKEFELYISLDGTVYSLLDTHQLTQASGNDLEAYTDKFDINFLARYIKIVITDTYSQDYVGLGKIMIFDNSNNLLFGDISALHEEQDITGNEESARLWLQDGLVIEDKIYLFPILVKDYLTYFQVHNVGLIEMDIVNNEFDYENATYKSTPLMAKTSDGGIIYFGAGVLDNRSVDGYIYVYGYKDLDGRHLTVARVTEENFLNFNEWTYYTGSTWSKDINQCGTLKDKVSAELSVTYMAEGEFAGKYMLVVMENTTSGYISYAISDTPYGAFSEYVNIYHTTEKEYLVGAFSYNAKLHPNLSTYDKLIISYNVNTNNLGTFADGRIYYPRFISITKVKEEA